MVPANASSVRFVALLFALLVVARPAAADSRQDTDTALAAERKADQEMATAAAAKTALQARYRAELGTIDRLKKQRGSWRRDRQLRDSLAASLETAKKLEASTSAVQRAALRQRQARERAALAVTAELRGAGDPARLTLLRRERARLSPGVAPGKKITIPELELDPLADPEELEQQALAIRQSETALAQQVAMLDDRSKRLDEVAELRRQHSRAEILSDRDDNRTRRGAAQRRESEGANTDASDSGAPPTSVPPVTETSGRPSSGQLDSPDVLLLAESSAVLGEVIDAATLETLRKAQASPDPAVRAAAAKLAREAAAAKLATLRKQRALIEARVRALRAPAR